MREETPHDPIADDRPGPLGPDPEIRAALGAYFGGAPTDAVDWPALEARVTEAARFRLARRARAGGWRGAAERWARIAIPTGLAATLMLAAGLAFSAPDGAVTADIAMDELVAVSASDGLPVDPLGLADQEAFLAAVLDSTE